MVKGEVVAVVLGLVVSKIITRPQIWEPAALLIITHVIILETSTNLIQQSPVHNNILHLKFHF